MSLNHISTDLQETPWWQQQQEEHQHLNMEPTQDTPSSKPHKNPTPQQQYSSWPSHLYHHQLWVNSYNSHESPSMFSTQSHPFNLNQEDDEQDLEDHSTPNQEPPPKPHHHLEKEPMFEKPLTPSDVGKLNRLVIPKQHAEKYFPLSGDSGDRGLLLTFEDESGKCWRFRYSYWNSSQSYVLTKGWSRYVKEKRLDAGDVIQFERHRRDSERLFIGWRRRGTAATGGGGGWNRGGHPYPVEAEVQNRGVTSVPYQPVDSRHAGSSSVQSQGNPVGNSKRLRLFGVNLECQLDESEPSTPNGSSLSTSTQSQHHHHHFYSHHHPSYSSNPHSHMDITFSEDVNEKMRNRQG